MFFSRFYTFFFLLVSIGLFTHAKPVDAGLAVREELGNSLVKRGFPGSPCNCGGDLVDVLTTLKANITFEIGSASPPGIPTSACNAIIAALNAAVSLIATINLQVAFTTAQITACAGLIVDIIIALVGWLSLWTIGTLVSLCGSIDVALAACIQACVTLCPSISVQLILSVALGLQLTLLGFVKTLLLVIIH